MGEGTTDFWILARHKVTRSVSTDSASQSTSRQAKDYRGPQQGQVRNMSSLLRFLSIMPNTFPC